MDDEPEVNLYQWIKVFDNPSPIKHPQSSVQKKPTQACAFQSQGEFPTDMDCSFSPEFLSDSPEPSPSYQSLLGREESATKISNSSTSVISVVKSIQEVGEFVPGCSESCTANSPSVLTWRENGRFEPHEKGTWSESSSPVEIPNVFCYFCKSWAKNGLKCSWCVTHLISCRKQEINKCENSITVLVNAARALDKLKKRTLREQHELRMRNTRRRLVALQQLLERERIELEALTRAHHKQQCDLVVKELKLKVARGKLKRVKLLHQSWKGINLKAKVNIVEKKKNVLQNERRKYILNGLMYLFPVDIIDNSINGITIPRELTPSCVYVPNLEQIYGYIILYMLKLEQFYTSQYVLRRRLSFHGTRSMISDGTDEYALHLRCNSKKGVKNYQKAIDLFDKQLMTLATLIGVPRHCLKRFCLIGNLWNILTFIHEHKRH